MAVNGITNRLSGLGGSGIDTDAIVKSLMAIEKVPQVKLKQKLQLDQWRTDAYRDITSQLNGLQSDFLDVLSTTNMRSQSSYKAYSISALNSSGNKSDVVSAIGSTNAGIGTHTITVNNMAVSQEMRSSGNVSMAVTGSQGVDWTSAEGQNFVLNVDGTSKTINIAAGTDSSAKLQTLVDAAFGSGKVAVGQLANRLTFDNVGGSGVNKITIGSGSNDALDNLGFSDSYANFSNRIKVGDTLENIANEMNSSLSFDSSNNIALNINGKSFTFAKTTTLSSMMSQISNDADANVTMSYDDMSDTFKFVAKQSGAGNNVNISEAGSTFLTSAGITSGTSVTGSQAMIGASNMNYTGANSKSFSVNINGTVKQITLNGDYRGSDDSDYSNLTAAVQAGIQGAFTGANISVTETNGALNIVDSDGNPISVGAPTGGTSALSDLGLKTSFVSGKDANITLDGQNLTRSSNSFSVSGITYTILKQEKTPTEQTVAASLDVSGVFDKISKFVAKYNDVINNINGKLSDDYDSSYQPLTDDQRAAMNADDIKAWETKAKTGLLRNDPILQNIVYNMRKALYDPIAGVSTTLSSIGISTGAYQEKGKLNIDEAKLKSALQTNIDGVMNLFSQESKDHPGTLTVRSLDSTSRSTRNNQEGLAYRLYDIIQDNTSIIKDTHNHKGTLLEKAGIVGDTSEITSTLHQEMYFYNTQITEMNDALIAKENAYYAKFTNMEQLLSQMNAQSSQLTSFGQQQG
jgi:flagellar hook-associated protein 2